MEEESTEGSDLYKFFLPPSSTFFAPQNQNMD